MPVTSSMPELKAGLLGNLLVPLQTLLRCLGSLSVRQVDSQWRIPCKLQLISTLFHFHMGTLIPQHHFQIIKSTHFQITFPNR